MNQITLDQIILEQRRLNKKVAKHIGSDEKTAFHYITQVARRLSVSITEDLLLLFIKLCHNIGIDRFAGSLALGMTNAGATKKDVKRYCLLMQNY